MTGTDDVLTAQATEFLTLLAREFRGEREELLAARDARAKRLREGELPDFLPQTAAIREGHWRVPSAPADLSDRRVEITGPTDRKMVINALNSGARVFMADFEDSNSPTWENMVDGQRNLTDAIERTIHLETPEKVYELDQQVATLLVRPRGWHLLERHFEVDDAPIPERCSTSACTFFATTSGCGRSAAARTSTYQSSSRHREALLWNRVFERAQDELGLPRGTIRATVLIETILAAFEMDEILHALGPHATGLNAGRWDYLFSVIKKLGHREEFVLPDRNVVGMNVPFMRAYAELLVATCHRRRAHAIGGMAAFIPSRRDPEVNATALAKVREDKEREASQGYDGTWVAHPDLVPVALEVFDRVLGDRPNQLDVLREDIVPDAARAAGRRRDARRGDRGGPSQRRLRRHPVHPGVAQRFRRRRDQQPDGGCRHQRDLPRTGVAMAAPRTLHA